jgi:prepilin-type N-terminal cleavage/methylation domain-containing protein/prepilin-type processing-associated H-X9-DG protein
MHRLHSVRLVQQGKKGFTLIELLVVIAIIAILAAILFPVFAQARAKARQASCLSNVKQLTLGMMQYVQDYDETYPIRWYTGAQPNPPAPFGWYNWDYLIFPYVRNGDVYRCPSHTSDPSLSTYGYNGNLGREYNWVTKVAGNMRGQRMAVVGAPAQVIMIYDTSSEGNVRRLGQGNGAHEFRVGALREGLPNWDKNTFQTRHSMGDNIGFADGHAKWYKTDAINALFTGSGLRGIPDTTAVSGRDFAPTVNGISFWPGFDGGNRPSTTAPNW